MKITSILLIIFLFFSCTQKVEKEKLYIRKAGPNALVLEPEALANIKVMKVVSKEFPEILNVMGRIAVVEDRVTVVPARVAGRIDSIDIASGEPVLKGTLLAQIFSPDYAAAREEFLQSSQQANDNKNSDFGNLAKLARRKLKAFGLNEEDIRDLAKTSHQNLPVRSPRAGFIIDKKALVGNMANLGDTLFTVADIDKVWFSGDLYPEDLEKVKKNQNVFITTTDAKKVYGQVSFISPVVDPTTRTIKIRAIIANDKTLLRADMYVQGSIILSQKVRLVVPNSAIVSLQNKNFIFKKTATSEFTKVEVEVLKTQQTDIAIGAGLTENDEVVSEGALLLDAALRQAN
jgi:Cu(I)/Ag(I) efflux system membrane fusion protein